MRNTWSVSGPLSLPGRAARIGPDPQKPVRDEPFDFKVERLGFLIATLQIDLPRRRPDPEASGAARRLAIGNQSRICQSGAAYWAGIAFVPLGGSHLARRCSVMTRAH